MAGLLPGDPSHHGMVESGPYHFTREKHEDSAGSRWYFSRKEIEENSPSRRDGIDLKKETYFRKSYCTFLQDLGMRLKVPQVTIATAIIFCHRFFLRQSHAKNERRTIATVCMFLAGKVEETPRPLKDVILVSYEIIHKKDPSAVQKIKQKEVYEEQKELILLGERVVLATLGFDLNLQHPYKPLVEAIKKFKVAQNALAQVAWNFVNDGLRTSLCLQFKPHHIAAGAIFLAAKFLKVKLPSDGEKFWWQEFDVTPRQLEEVSNQMLELYEQNRNVQSSHGSEVEGSMGSAANQRSSSKAPASEEPVPTNTCSQVGSVSVKHGSSVTSSAHTGSGQSFVDNDTDTHKATKTQVLDGGPVESRGGTRQKVDCASAEMDSFPSIRDHNAENPNRSKFRSERTMNDGKRKEMGEVLEEKEWKDEGCLHLSNSTNVRNSGNVEGPKGYCPQDVITKIDKDKVKAALEKRKKFRGDLSRNTDMMDEDDLIERELENGIELAAEDDKNKDRALHSKSLNRSEVDNVLYDKEQHENTQGKKFVGMEYQSTGRTRPGPVDKGAIMDPYSGSHISNENIEEGELSLPDCSPRFVSRNEKGAGVEKYRHDYSQHPYGYSNRQESSKDANRSGGRLDHVEREHKRHRHESHV